MGHGTRSVDDLVEVLRAGGVEVVVDVRRYPGSRRHPHLSRASLAPALAERGIAYDLRGEALGGRRKVRADSRHPAWRNESFRAYADHMDTAGFRSALDALLGDVRSGPPLAVMCAETLWWRCHRRLVADAAVLAGTDVVHLLDESTRQPHPLHPAVRPDDEGRPVYDAGVVPLI